MSAPLLSVIVPVHQGARVLPGCLAALRRSDLPRDRWELIVVDDASPDDSAVVASRYADTVVRLRGTPRGPAYARNRGVEAARGEILVFIDADVRVHETALRRFAELFEARPDVSAAFGAYDLDPARPGFISQYRNLFQAFLHRRNAGDAETFWAACGAVRRDAFLTVGKFDEWHHRSPQLEDVELGRRLRRAGHRILADPTIEVKHLKRWTLRGAVAAEFRNQGVHRLWLRLQEQSADRAPAAWTVEDWSRALVAVAALALLAAALVRSAWPLPVAALALLAVVGANHALYRFLYRRRGLRFAAAALPLHLLQCAVTAVSAFTAWWLRQLFGAPSPPPDVEATAAVGVQTWPPVPARPQASIWNLPSE